VILLSSSSSLLPPSSSRPRRSEAHLTRYFFLADNIRYQKKMKVMASGKSIKKYALEAVICLKFEWRFIFFYKFSK
jgi:hypothetical protein